MKLVALIVLLAACKGSDHDTPPPVTGSATAVTPPTAATPPTATAPPVLDVCSIGVAALDKASCSTPESLKGLQQAKKTLAGILDVMHQAATADPRQLQITCAQLVQAVEHDAAGVNCTLGISDDDRKAVDHALEAWYAERTPVTPTGDPDSDAVIAKVAGVRDAMCACTEMDCLGRVDKQLDAMGSLPASAPKAAKDLGSALLDDVGRCESKIRTAAGK